MKRLVAPVVLLLSGACGGEKPPMTELPNGSFTAELGARTVHYEIHGRGPVLMTLPNSWGLSLEGLRSLYRPLEERLTLVYFDPRGMGSSGPVTADSDLGPDAVRADFHALQKHLELDSVNAIGWSNGATNLVLLASERPDALTTAIFVHGNASFDSADVQSIVADHPELTKSFAEFSKEMAESGYTPAEQNARVKEFDTEVWFPWMFTDHEAGKTILPEVFRDAEFSWAHAQYTERQWPTVDFRDRLPQISARALVIAGRHDMLPPERAQEIADGIAGSRFVVFEESGHFAPIEEEAEFTRTVFDFLGVLPE